MTIPSYQPQMRSDNTITLGEPVPMISQTSSVGNVSKLYSEAEAGTNSAYMNTNEF